MGVFKYMNNSWPKQLLSGAVARPSLALISLLRPFLIKDPSFRHGPGEHDGRDRQNRRRPRSDLYTTFPREI